jgi:hypothetical protein
MMRQLLYQMCGVDKLSTVRYNPHAMGVVERFNKTMVAFLTKNYDISQADWEAKLPALMWQYNSIRHSITGFTPALLQIRRAISSGFEEPF